MANRERDLRRAMNFRLMTGHGYAKQDIVLRSFTKQKLQEELKWFEDAIVEGWKKGYLVGFLKPRSDNSDRGRLVYGNPNPNENELHRAARALLKRTLGSWKDSNTQMVYVELDESGENARLSYPLRRSNLK